MRREDLLRSVLLLAGLAVLVFAAYAASLRFPFIQDDWAWITRFRTESAGAILKSIFALGGNLFFRPLSGLYLYCMYVIFGGSPAAFHIAALLILIANSWLVTRIMKVVTGDGVISITAGFLFAAGASVHLETLLWAVGINDLGATFLFLLSMLLFLEDRSTWSTVAFVVGCLFKETVLVLPFILLGYVLIGTRRGQSARERALRRLAPMAIAFLALFLMKLVAGSFVSLPQAHPYALRFAGPQLLHNLYSYIAWMVQCFDAFLSSAGMTMKYAMNDLILLLLLGIWVASRTPGDEASNAGEIAERGVSAIRKDNTSRGPEGLLFGSRMQSLRFLLVWLFVPLVPLILLVNHTYRYYAVYSLPAFVGATFMLVRIVCGSARRAREAGRGLIIGVAVGAALLSFLQTQVVLREGMVQVTLADGTNYLVRRAKIVEMVRDGLTKQLPAPPRGATILLGDADLGAFDGDAGPQAWYRDPTLKVYRLDDLDSDQTGVYVHRPPEGLARPYEKPGPARIYLDPAKIFAFRLDESGLRPVDLGKTPTPAVAPPK